MVVWCKFAEADKHLKNLKGNQGGKLQTEKASPRRIERAAADKSEAGELDRVFH
jgi:hypothetical protein